VNLRRDHWHPVRPVTGPDGASRRAPATENTTGARAPNPTYPGPTAPRMDRPPNRGRGGGGRSETVPLRRRTERDATTARGSRDLTGPAPDVLPGGKRTRPSTTDTSGPSSMKNAARCDTSREMRNAVNHRDFQRGRRPRGLPGGTPVRASPTDDGPTRPERGSAFSPPHGAGGRPRIPAKPGPRPDPPAPKAEAESTSGKNGPRRWGTRGDPHLDLGSGEITR
jgi:hypothetical protein